MSESPVPENSVSRIVIDPACTLGTIDRKVFGGFVEHLGRCIYGGLYEEGSPLAGERGFRTDVLDPRSGVRSGSRVAFRLDASRLYFFDPATGDAVGWPAAPAEAGTVSAAAG